MQKGIWQCISLYTEAPPRGKKDNFGFAALQYWAKMLTNTRNKQSWERLFAPGSQPAQGHEDDAQNGGDQQHYTDS